MIIHSHRRIISAPKAQKQPEPQIIVEEKLAEEVIVKKTSSKNKAKKIIEELEFEEFEQEFLSEN